MDAPFFREAWGVLGSEPGIPAPSIKKHSPAARSAVLKNPFPTRFANGKRDGRVSISPTMTPQELKYKVCF
jgi:hypothetical protein